MSRLFHKKRSEFLELFKSVYDLTELRQKYRNILNSKEHIEPIKVQKQFIEAYIYYCTNIIKEPNNGKIQDNINIIKQEGLKR